MAIENIHQHFLDIIKQDQATTDELADLYVHEMEFPDEYVEDVIYNSTVKTLKSIGVFSKTRPNKRDSRKSVKMTAFELSPSDTAKYGQRLRDLAKEARKVVFTKSNIEKVYSKHFGEKLTMSPDGFIQFPEGVYGRISIANNKRARHLAQREITVEGVKEVLRDFVDIFEEDTKHTKTGGFYTGVTGAGDQQKLDKMHEMHSGTDDVPVRAIDSHSVEGHDTTTATVNAMKKLAEADAKIAQIVGNITDHHDVIATTRNRMFEIFDEFEVENEKITDIVRAGQGEVTDNLVVKLQYGTDKLNRTMSAKDRDGIEQKLNNIAEKQLAILAKSRLSKRSKRYKELKGSKSFDDRLIDGSVNVTIDMVEGVEKISKLLKGVKVTKGKKVKAKKKQTTSKTTKGKIVNRKRTVKNVKKAKKLRKENLAATGKYNPRVAASETSLAALMQQINKSLPRHLKGNMEPPALQYRGIGNPKQGTGPFNTGVRLTSLRNLKKVQGGLQVNYTYEKYPYQTFEPGFKQGDVLRDPRQLIQESIRDIMIERKQTRFLNFRRY